MKFLVLSLLVVSACRNDAGRDGRQSVADQTSEDERDPAGTASGVRGSDAGRGNGDHTSHHGDDASASEDDHDEQPPLTPSDAATASGGSVTFDDVAPVFERSCVSCHRADGAGPFRLDRYEDAQRHGGAIVAATASRLMPPWHITSDDSCGKFADVKQLADEDIALLARWVEQGTQPGANDVITVAPPASLEGARVYTTPAYKPTVIGPPLAEQDDYRCFLIEPELAGEQFITAYEIDPEEAHLVHHAIAYVIDPEAPSRIPGIDNAALMGVLDSTSPDVPGWQCLVEAGDGITMRATPATWLPGQPPMALPNESGVRVKPSYKYVLQVHYNLGHAPAAGAPSKVDLHFRYADTVKNEGIFITGDGLLATVTDLAPVGLEPGRASEVFHWQRTMAEMGLTLPKVDLWAVYPHMHELGHKYRMTFKRPGEAEQCAADVQAWDFHWQRMYAYREPLVVTPDMLLDVTCDYDTRSRTEPTLPGASTANEMCSAIMYFTTPLATTP